MRHCHLGLIALLAAACGGAQERPDPPSGAVDPGIHGLVTPGEAGRAAPRPAADPGAGLLGALPGPLPGATPAPPHAAPPAAGQGAAPPVREATGAITMTREHCETLGRKFAALTMAQAPGGGAAMEQEAAGVGRTFADRCAHEMVGQTVDVREYECMLQAHAATELLGCKR